MQKIIITIINGIPIHERRIQNLPCNSALSKRARFLRQQGIFSEVVFWKEVRNGTFHNLDFDRQKIIGSFIVDFYVKSLGLVIEIDGSSHNLKEEYDLKREAYLLGLGLKLFRVSDFRVLHDLRNVMEELEVYIVECFGET